MLSQSASWNNPVQNAVDSLEIEKLLMKGASFLLDPRFTVLDSSEEPMSENLQLSWIKSATWPLPWRPRIQILGKTQLKLKDGKINEVIDAWDAPLVPTVLPQLLPRFWDMYHFAASPVAEMPAYKVVFKGKGYEVRDYAPRVVIVGKRIDNTNSREARKAQVLPDFMFTDKISMTGKKPEEYYTTSPIEVLFQGKLISNFNSTQNRINVIHWRIGTPTKFGQSIEEFPNVDGGVDIEQGEEICYEKDPWRRLAVMSFNGQNQDIGISEARNELQAKVRADGFKAKGLDSGKLKFSFFQNDAKAGFKKTNALSLCMYEPRPIHNGNQIVLELEF